MNQDQLWTYFQDQGAATFQAGHGRLSFVASRLEKRLAGRTGARVLNVGVGDGFLERRLAGRGHEVYWLDPDPGAVDRLASELGLEGRGRSGRIEAMPFEDGFFQAVVVSEVFEHLTTETLATAAAECARVTAESGLLLVTVPAREDLSAETFLCPHCGERFHRWGHAQSFDPQRLESVFEPRFQTLTVMERPFFTWKTLNWKGKAAAGVQSALRRLGVHGGAETIFYCGRKR